MNQVSPVTLVTLDLRELSQNRGQRVLPEPILDPIPLLRIHGQFDEQGVTSVTSVTGLNSICPRIGYQAVQFGPFRRIIDSVYS